MRATSGRGLEVASVAKFTAAVALLAIFADAAVGHGLTWENDPYWTYWVTKTFLIATVFGLGTAWFGIGVAQGAAITAVHTLVLTVYYWSLSPIGLPSHPEWLDLEHTWLTGIPIHFGVIFLGYLAALFLYRRRRAADLSASRLAWWALSASIAVVVVGGGLTSLVLWDFPGVTWFVVRLLVTVTFVLLWWGVAGRGVVSSTAGAIALAFAWAVYGQYLGPSGLPDWPIRAFHGDPPPATVSWMSYHDLWLVLLPIVLVVATCVLVAWPRLLEGARRGRHELGVPVAATAIVVLPLVAGIPFVSNGGTKVDVSASGATHVENGAWFSGTHETGSGTLTFSGTDTGARVTPLPPHDRVDLDARLATPRGTFQVTSRQPMVDDPLGRWTTWWGIGLDVWHHGRSGIGTSRLPATKSKVALFALGSVRADRRTLATGVPIHLMTLDEGLELDVGDPQTPVPGLPNGHLRVMWDAYRGGASQELHAAAYTIGGIELVVLLALAGLGVVRRTDDLV